MPKKLLQINPVVKENTSTGKIMRELGDLAMAAGWESYLVYSRARDGVPPHSSILVPVGNKADLLFHWVVTRFFDAHGLVSRRATRKLIRRIREIDPDIIHIHNVHGYFLHYPTLCRFLAERGKPVIWTVHDCWLFTGHCYHYAAAGCDRWQTGCHHCPQKKAFPASYGFDRSRKNFIDKQQAFAGISSLTLVAVSEWMRGELSRSFLKSVPCRVISNGIDLNTFQPRPDPDLRTRYGITRPRFYLAVASIWLPEKGIADIIDLSGKLQEDEQLVMVGKIDAKLLKTLPKTIVTIDRTADAQALASLYTEATALVNPTWQDNYPTVNMESMACGTPVVTYRTGGSVESVTPKTGIVVRQGDVDALAQALRQIRETDRATWQKNCRDHAAGRFDRNERFKDYIRLYEDLATR
ncbi:MAG: glycosyltransferase [Bacteroidales bacterium]|nr:glycosyltransferase [Bacteroidales bacterium]